MSLDLNDQRVQELEESLSKRNLELQKCYYEFGKSLLDLADAKLITINRLVEEIIEIKKLLTMERNEIQCQECMSQNTADSKFCKYCGSKLSDIKH